MVSWCRFNGDGGNQNVADWVTIERLLEGIRYGSGSVNLHRMDAPDVGPQKLQVQSEYSQYMLTLGENTVDDYEVRTYDNGQGMNGLVGFGGEPFPACSVFSDFHIVLRAFREFFDTGDVSRELLK